MVQTFPEPATRSDLMPIFVKGCLGKKYSVREEMGHPVLETYFGNWLKNISKKGFARVISKV